MAELSSRMTWPTKAPPQTPPQKKKSFPLRGSHMFRHAQTSGEAQRLESSNQQSTLRSVSVQMKTLHRHYFRDSRLIQQLWKFFFLKFFLWSTQSTTLQWEGWLGGSRLCLSQLFSFSRCWSSSLLACCSLPQLQPSQQPQLFSIWRPSQTQMRGSPSLKMAPSFTCIYRWYF